METRDESNTAVSKARPSHHARHAPRHAPRGTRGAREKIRSMKTRHQGPRDTDKPNESYNKQIIRNFLHCARPAPGADAESYSCS